MASLFARDRRKSASINLNEEPPEFNLLFLGKSLTERKMGKECTSEIVSSLVERSRGKELKRVKLTISSRGIWVTEGSDPKKLRDTLIPIYSVSYGAADKNYTRVFSFVTNFSKNDPNIAEGRKSTMPFYCYSFVTSTPAVARGMVVYLLRSFKLAYESWKRSVKSQRLRDKIKAGPGHNSFNPPEKTTESSLTEAMARLDQLTGISSSDKGSDSSQSDVNITPPDETATRSDKVLLWMDKWLGTGFNKTRARRQSDDSSSSASDNVTTKNEENDAFAEREHEFADPTAMLNDEVDIVSELQDPEVRSVFEELADSKNARNDKPAVAVI
ncbi:low density lipoprotein receptor adapter protein 1-like [Diadema setosum]|uniref:low density lipoprotein receptor adapter protein 1-like n=1 Tax=Diadema setosum TaxID=31175 RepID=UPI003B3B52B4